MIGYLLEQIAKYEKRQSELEAQMAALEAMIRDSGADERRKSGGDSSPSRFEMLYRALADLMYELGGVDALLGDARARAGEYAPTHPRFCLCDPGAPAHPQAEAQPAPRAVTRQAAPR